MRPAWRGSEHNTLSLPKGCVLWSPPPAAQPSPPVAQTSPPRSSDLAPVAQTSPRHFNVTIAFAASV